MGKDNMKMEYCCRVYTVKTSCHHHLYHHHHHHHHHHVLPKLAGSLCGLVASITLMLRTLRQPFPSSRFVALKVTLNSRSLRKKKRKEKSTQATGRVH
eukprot:1160911-Pelagomonas_calceolata.AAC.4